MVSFGHQWGRFSATPFVLDLKLIGRIEILDWHNKNGRNQSKTARHFNPIYPNLKIKQPLVSTWVNDEAKWREQWEQTNSQSDCTAKRA